jgi:AAA domain
MRTFKDKPAVRTSIPLMTGLMGPSGGGKTFSALRLATGIQRVSGGDIFMIDTEARRGLHYADRFTFRHLAFGAPFSPLDYLAAIEHCIAKGAKTIIVDSLSHEHEGPGGVLEWHEAELERMGGGDKNNFRAWAVPKAARRRLINTLLQLPCNFIFCFRAKDKAKPGKDAAGKAALVDLGFMPITGEEFVYEMTLNALLLPNAGGVPAWSSDFRGERQMIKLPQQFAEMFKPSEPLSEDHGERMAKWAAGGVVGRPDAKAPAAGCFRSGPMEGRPLAEGGIDALVEYELAIKNMKKPGNQSKHAAIDLHLEEIAAVIIQKEG